MFENVSPEHLNSLEDSINVKIATFNQMCNVGIVKQYKELYNDLVDYFDTQEPKETVIAETNKTKLILISEYDKCYINLDGVRVEHHYIDAKIVFKDYRGCFSFGAYLCKDNTPRDFLEKYVEKIKNYSDEFGFIKTLAVYYV